MKPGAYMLFVTTTGPNRAPREVVLEQDGRPIASAPIRWNSRPPQTIKLGNHLSFVIENNRASGNLYGIGELISEKTLIVDEVE